MVRSQLGELRGSPYQRGGALCVLHCVYMAAGPFHGDDLVDFLTVTSAIRAHFAAAPYKQHVFARDTEGNMYAKVRQAPGLAAAAEIREGLRLLYPNLAAAGGFTLTVEYVAPVVTWKTVYDVSLIRIRFNHN